MYVYRSFEPGLWTVGFYAPNGEWYPDSDYESRESAANRVHYLNGGTTPDDDGGLYEEYKQKRAQWQEYLKREGAA